MGAYLIPNQWMIRVRSQEPTRIQHWSCWCVDGFGGGIGDSYILICLGLCSCIYSTWTWLVCKPNLQTWIMTSWLELDSGHWRDGWFAYLVIFHPMIVWDLKWSMRYGGGWSSCHNYPRWKHSNWITKLFVTCFQLKYTWTQGFKWQISDSWRLGNLMLDNGCQATC